MFRRLLLALLFALPLAAAPQNFPPSCAGAVVADDEIRRSGVDARFRVCEIDDEVFARMQGKSYKADCPLPRGELRLIRVLHVDFEGATRAGEMVCHRTIARELVELFRALYEARYPIERMVLVDAYDGDDERSMAANNTSCFNFRRIAGSTRLSKHAQGLAVDINPLYNPCVVRRNGRTSVQPAAGAPYADRSRPFPGRIDREDLCCRLFRERGFVWGGDWRSLKDYQHFEKRLPEEP